MDEEKREGWAACPCCGEDDIDRLIWTPDGDHVESQTCGAYFDPLEE